MTSTALSKKSILKHRRRFFIAIAAIAIVLVSLISFAAYAYSFNLDIVKATAPAQLNSGSQTPVVLIVHYNKMNNPFGNHITLSLSGTGALWASFEPQGNPYNPSNNVTQMLPQITVSTPSDGAVFLIKVPNDAKTGSYEIKVTGTNTMGITSSVTYTFTVT